MVFRNIYSVLYLKAFIAVVQPDKLKEKESKKKQEVEPALQYPSNFEI